MTAQIIDGKALANTIKQRLKQEVEVLQAQGIRPALSVILVGNDPASQVYIRNKEKACQNAGIVSEVLRLPEQTTQAELLEKLQERNGNPAVHGILVQLPLPSHIKADLILNTIRPEKDVDGFHPVNMGKLLAGQPGSVPCTPAGILELIKTTGVPIKGKEAVVIGRSNIVGKPAMVLLLREHATVTVCHSHTVNLPEVARRADILVVAIGKARMVDKSFVKPGAIVIDVGINDEAGKMVGDVYFDEVKDVAGWITPVPGGVGPMTIAMLLQNTLAAARAR